jgi:hypothetical protein
MGPEFDHPISALPWAAAGDNSREGGTGPEFDRPISALPWVEGEDNSHEGMGPEFDHPRSVRPLAEAQKEEVDTILDKVSNRTVRLQICREVPKNIHHRIPPTQIPVFDLTGGKCPDTVPNHINNRLVPHKGTPNSIPRRWVLAVGILLDKGRNGKGECKVVSTNIHRSWEPKEEVWVAQMAQGGALDEGNVPEY